MGFSMQCKAPRCPLWFQYFYSQREVNEKTMRYSQLMFFSKAQRLLILFVKLPFLCSAQRLGALSGSIPLFTKRTEREDNEIQPINALL